MRTPMRPGWYNYGFATGLALAAFSMVALVIAVNINPAPSVPYTLAGWQRTGRSGRGTRQCSRSHRERSQQGQADQGVTTGLTANIAWSHSCRPEFYMAGQGRLNDNRKSLKEALHHADLQLSLVTGTL